MKVHHSDLLWVPNWLAALLNPVLGSWWNQTPHRLLLVNDWPCLGANTSHSYRMGDSINGNFVSRSLHQHGQNFSGSAMEFELFLFNFPPPLYFISDLTSCSEDSPYLLLLLHRIVPNSSASNPILASASWMMWISIPSKKRKTLKQLDRLPTLEL